MRYPKCAICGKHITYKFWVCAKCEKEWGLVDVDYKDWPQWVKVLKNFEQAARNRSIRDYKYLEEEELTDDLLKRGGVYEV